MNNTELRHSLYNELLQYATERIIHHDNWQYKTSRYLMRIVLFKNPLKEIF